MATATATKKAIQTLAEQQQRRELAEFEAEATAHIEHRETLRNRMQWAIDDATRNAEDYAKLKAEWLAKAEEQRNDDGDSISRNAALHEAVTRLHSQVNNWKHAPANPGEAERLQLVAECRDEELNKQHEIVSDLLSQAKQRLEAAIQTQSRAYGRASEARSERLRILGAVSEQFGQEGQRWKRVVDGDSVTIATTKPHEQGGVHASNVEYINSQLVPLNRRIEEAAEVKGIDHEPMAEVDELTEQLEAVETAMVDSEI